MSEVNYRRGNLKKYSTRDPDRVGFSSRKSNQKNKRLKHKIDRRANADALRGVVDGSKRTGIHCRSGVVCDVRHNRINPVEEY